MGCFFVKATPGLVYQVSKNMRDRDLQELLATSWEDDREKLASSLANHWGNFPLCFCIGYDQTPVCIVTAVILRPGVWSLGMWATPEIHKIGKFLTKFVSNKVFDMMKSCGAHRIEVKSIMGYTSVHKWLRFLGFAEGPIEKMYGKNKEDFVTFIWNEEMPWPRGYRP